MVEQTSIRERTYSDVGLSLFWKDAHVQGRLAGFGYRCRIQELQEVTE